VVYVVVALETSLASGPVFIGWCGGGLHATTPGVQGSSVTCRIPRRLFEDRALLRLQLIGSAESEGPVFAWTQIPVLGEAVFRAEMMWDRPILSLVVLPSLDAASRPDWFAATA
jgi:hypothetical protein